MSDKITANPDDGRPLEPSTPQAPVKSPAPKKPRTGLRTLAYVFGSLLALLILLTAGISWYATTTDFQQRVGGEVVSVLENATGGRVELKHLSFNPWRLAIEVDGLVIHGTEAPGQMPYLSAAKVILRLHLNMVLAHIRGLGPQSRISLRYLRADQPRIHLIVDKDGKTNQPTPKRPNTSSTSIEDTLLNLQAGKVELVNGLALLNDKAIPFDLTANDLSAHLEYLRKTDRYGATVDLADLRTKMDAQPEVKSKLHLTAEMGRDMVALRTLDFWSGAPDASGAGATHLSATAELQHFAKPEWQMALSGNVELKQLSYLTNVDGLDAGTMDVTLHGHNCSVTPQVVPKNPHFWQRHKKAHVAPNVKTPPSDSDCTEAYVLVGSMKVHKAAYHNPFVRVQGIDGGAHLHITPRVVLLTEMTGRVPGGGGASGELRSREWPGRKCDGYGGEFCDGSCSGDDSQRGSEEPGCESTG